jgi:hypothetical protein
MFAAKRLVAGVFVAVALAATAISVSAQPPAATPGTCLRAAREAAFACFRNSVDHDALEECLTAVVEELKACIASL